jgi:MtN3 and saliva related transmembrane protein
LRGDDPAVVRRHRVSRIAVAARVVIAGFVPERVAVRRVAMPMDLNTLVGSVAAFCTTVSYFPQLKKCWETGSAGDLSLKMFSILATGIALWVIYGILQGDIVIIVANTISLCLLAGILYFKIRELRSPQSENQDKALKRS